MKSPGASALVFLFALVLASPVRADVTISFPLGPVYRPGRYVPVRVRADLPGGKILRLAATNALTTEIELDGGRCDAVFPWLLVGRPTDARWSCGQKSGAFEAPIDVIRPDEQIIVVTGAADFAASPGTRVVRADAAVISQCPLAWELAGRVVVESAGAFDSATLSLLAGGGTSIAVKSDRSPGSAWRAEGPYQVLSHPVVGPADFVMAESVYGPALNWTAAWPKPFRIRLMIYAAIAAIVLLGVTLLPRRWSLLGVVVAALGISATLYFTWRQAPLLERRGEIDAIDRAHTQRDEWTWLSAIGPTEARIDASGGTRPVFYSRRLVDSFDGRIRCIVTGQMRELILKLTPGRPIALLRRTLATSIDVTPTLMPRLSAMADFAADAYTTAGWRITGEESRVSSQPLIELLNRVVMSR